jgi:hypothetical protein
MKTALTVLVIVLAVLACGCTAPAPAAAPATCPLPATTPAAAIPNLTGSWTGPMRGFDEGTGFTDYSSLAATMTVYEQHGRLFAGQIVFKENGTETRSGFAGAIGQDGRTLAITEQHGGYCSGEVLGPDEIELTYMQDGSPFSIAIDSFKRV